MQLNCEAVREYADRRGWSDLTLARKLGLNYSYVYRVMRNQRGIGRKFISGFLKLCEREGLEFKEYVDIHASDRN